MVRSCTSTLFMDSCRKELKRFLTAFALGVSQTKIGSIGGWDIRAGGGRRRWRKSVGLRDFSDSTGALARQREEFDNGKPDIKPNGETEETN